MHNIFLSSSYVTSVQINFIEKKQNAQCTMHLMISTTLHFLLIYTTSLSLQTVRAAAGLAFSSSPPSSSSINAYYSNSPSHSYSYSHCRYLPEDAQWPSPQDWAHLNSTVAGKLIRTIPLATPCHDPTFNEGKCEQFRALWGFPNYQYDLP